MHMYGMDGYAASVPRFLSARDKSLSSKNWRSDPAFKGASEI
jgi:hypothetical protein